MNRNKFISGAKRKPIRRKPIGRGDRVRIKDGALRITDKYFDAKGIWVVGRRVRLTNGQRMFEIHRDNTMILCAAFTLERV
jgi:hypothetical protein